ncbi:MAG: hypothetical protein KDE31_00615, partial [Caldilineaceae bacterium]|nr:hypothetical protein [Caldilineaceae bacterium]
LAGKSQEELIALIKEMLKREPDLARLLELPVQPDRNMPVDLDAFRRQIQYALNQSDGYDYYDYGHASTMATELAAVVDTANRFRDGDDYINAGDIYALVLKEVVPIYQDLYDENGDVAIEMQRCAEGLESCFDEGTPNADTRRTWLSALLEATIMDVHMGGIDMAAPADDVIIANATDEEWDWIEARVRRVMGGMNDRYSSWGHEAMINFLARRMEAVGREDGVDDLVLNEGSPQQRAFLLAQRGRFDEAVTIARQHFVELPGLVQQFADALVAAGANEAAEAYMVSQLDTRSRSTCLKWLANHAKKTGNLAAAVDWWRQNIEDAPSFETYQSLRELANQLGQWHQTRLELLAALEAKEAWAVLLEIALDEDEVKWALDLLPYVRGWHSHDYALRVARAAEKEYPQAALEIYNRRVEQFIDDRNRGSYHEAAKLLVRVRAIYKAQGQLEAWQAHITDLRKDYKQLRALQDELKKAGL